MKKFGKHTGKKIKDRVSGFYTRDLFCCWERVVCFVLVLMVCSLNIYSQNQHKIDSLKHELGNFEQQHSKLGNKAMKFVDTLKVDLLYKISKEYWGNNPDSGMDYSNRALKLAEEIDYKKGIGNAYNGIGNIYDDIGDYVSAIEYFNKSLEIRKSINDIKGEADSYSNIGIINRKTGDYPAALKNYLQALKIREEIGDKKGIATSYNNIGIINKFMGKYDDALKSYQNCLRIQEEISDKKGMMATYNNIGVIYKLEKNYGEALKNYTLSLKLSEVAGDKKNILTSYNNIGIIYSLQKKYPEALKQYFMVLKIAEGINDRQSMAMSYNNIGEIYFKLENLPEALINEQRGLKIANEIGDLDLMKEIYNNFSLIYEKMGNYKLAYENVLLYKDIKDSIFSRERQNQINLLQKQNELDKKQADQEKKDALAAKDIKHQKTLSSYYIIGLILVSLLVIILFNRNIIKQRANELITKEKDKVEVEKARSDELLYNILPVEVADELKEKGSAKAVRYSSVTVMFTDFKDFSIISEHLSPERLVGELDDCFRAFDKIIGKYNIEKIKTIGDSYMCVGGLPIANSSHGENVANAALEIRNYMEEQKQIKLERGEIPFEIRIGINTGPVIAGIVGEKKFAYDIWGDTVNLASRMESGGMAGKINISTSTYELVKDKFKCEYRGRLQAKNKGEVEMYFLEKLT